MAAVKGSTPLLRLEDPGLELLRSGPASRNHDDLRMDAGRVAEAPQKITCV